MNSNQKKLKQMIRDQELTISDEELFTSSAYQKYLTSMAKAATGRYRQGLQALMEWDARADAGIAHTDNYKIHINAANEITQSFPSRYLRSESLVGFNGHETAHLLFSDFTALPEVATFSSQSHVSIRYESDQAFENHLPFSPAVYSPIPLHSP